MLTALSNGGHNLRIDWRTRRVLTATCAREAEKRVALLGWDQTPFLGIVELDVKVAQVERRVVRYGDSGLVLVSEWRQQTVEHFYKIWIIADDWEDRVRNNVVYAVAVVCQLVYVVECVMR